MDRIVVCTDLSDLSWAALGPATRLADAFGAELHLATVVEDPMGEGTHMFDPGASPALEKCLDEVVDSSRAAIEERLVAEGRAAQVHVRRGSRPAGVLAEIARDIGADLVVICTHGRSGLARVLMGSVAEQLVRASTTPVLVIPSPTEALSHS